jgi:hypothetical protein
VDEDTRPFRPDYVHLVIVVVAQLMMCNTWASAVTIRGELALVNDCGHTVDHLNDYSRLSHSAVVQSDVIGGFLERAEQCSLVTVEYSVLQLLRGSDWLLRYRRIRSHITPHLRFTLPVFVGNCTIFRSHGPTPSVTSL